MKKSSILTAVFIIASVVANCWTVLALTNFLPYPDYFPAVEPPQDDLPYLEGVAKSNGYYNICLALTNVTYFRTLDNIVVNIRSSGDKSNPEIYLNGTLTSTYPLVRLNVGDSLKINLTLPCAEYAAGSTVKLTMFFEDGIVGKCVTLPHR